MTPIELFQAANELFVASLTEASDRVLHKLDGPKGSIKTQLDELVASLRERYPEKGMASNGEPESTGIQSNTPPSTEINEEIATTSTSEDTLPSLAPETASSEAHLIIVTSAQPTLQHATTRPAPVPQVVTTSASTEDQGDETFPEISTTVSTGPPTAQNNTSSTKPPKAKSTLPLGTASPLRNSLRKLRAVNERHNTRIERTLSAAKNPAQAGIKRHDAEALAPGGFTKPRLNFSTEQPGSHTRDKTPSPSRASKSPEPKSAGKKPLWLPPGRATTPESNTVRKNTKTDGINRKPLAHLSGNTKPIGRATTPSKVTTAVEPQSPADVLKTQREALRKLLDQAPPKKARASVPVAVPAPVHPRVKVLRKEEQ